MKKNYSIQKKKNPLTVFLDILFKILIIITILIFVFIAFTKIDFSSSSLSLVSKKKTQVENHVPSELRWFNDFKGVENIPDKKANSGSSGFKYEGFNK